MANSIGDLYPTQIPELTDEANIRTALNLYHYGADSEAGVQAQSIAGYLGALESGKVATAPTVIAAGTDLNTVDATGFYYIPNVSGITNYPGATAYQGFLTVIKYSSDVISQQYQIIGATESSGGPASQLNKTYRRFKYAGSWKVWRTYISSDELTSIGDLRYYTQTSADAKFLEQADASDIYLTQVAAAESLLVQEVAVASTEYTLQLSDSSKVLNVSAASAATITIPLNSVAAFDIGTIINIYSTSDSAVNVVGETSQVIIRPFSNNKFRLYGKYTEISLRKRATNEWVAAGNIVEITE